MELLRQYWTATKKTITHYENRVDQWIVRNPLAVWDYIKFRRDQKVKFSSRHRISSLLSRYW